MNLGALGGALGSAAGAPLSQTKGSETERLQKDATTQQRQADTNTKAERASGVGQTEKNEHASDRDADGRRLWEAPPDTDNPIESKASDADTSRQSKDITGSSGNQLDLTG